MEKMKPNIKLFVYAAMITLFTISLAASLALASLTVDVYTNKGGRGIINPDGGHYKIGESITIYIDLSDNAERIRYRIIKPDGSKLTLYDGSLVAGHYRDRGFVGMSPGNRWVIVEVWKDNSYVYDEVYYIAYLETKFRGIVVGRPDFGKLIGVDGINVRVDEIISDQSTRLRIGDTVTVTWVVHPSYNVDGDIKIGDRVEISGAYRDIRETPGPWANLGEHWVELMPISTSYAKKISHQVAVTKTVTITEYVTWRETVSEHVVIDVTRVSTETKMTTIWKTVYSTKTLLLTNTKTIWSTTTITGTKTVTTTTTIIASSAVVGLVAIPALAKVIKSLERRKRC